MVVYLVYPFHFYILLDDPLFARLEYLSKNFLTLNFSQLHHRSIVKNSKVYNISCLLIKESTGIFNGDELGFELLGQPQSWQT